MKRDAIFFTVGWLVGAVMLFGIGFWESDRIVRREVAAVRGTIQCTGYHRGKVAHIDIDAAGLFAGELTLQQAGDDIVSAICRDHGV